MRFLDFAKNVANAAINLRIRISERPSYGIASSFVSEEEIRTGYLNQQSRNFFHTFGYIKIPRFLKPEISKISDEFDRVLKERFKTIERKNYKFPQFVDHSPYLVQLIEGEKLNRVVDSLLGNGALYKGSEASSFIHGSPWHRDYYNKIKSIKILAYLEKNDGLSGALRVIPGSHFLDDKYNQFLTHALTWPDAPIKGGFDEKMKLPLGNNPNSIDFNRILPQIAIENEPGDIIIFNQNLVHCANRPLHINFKNKYRRLIGIGYAANLLNIWPADKNPHKLMQEIKDVSRIEMKSFSLENFYGPYVLASKSPLLKPRLNYLRDLKMKVDDIFDGNNRDVDAEGKVFWERHFSNSPIDEKLDEKYFLN